MKSEIDITSKIITCRNKKLFKSFNGNSAFKEKSHSGKILFEDTFFGENTFQENSFKGFSFGENTYFLIDKYNLKSAKIDRATHRVVVFTYFNTNY